VLSAGFAFFLSCRRDGFVQRATAKPGFAEVAGPACSPSPPPSFLLSRPGLRNEAFGSDCGQVASVGVFVAAAETSPPPFSFSRELARRDEDKRREPSRNGNEGTRFFLSFFSFSSWVRKVIDGREGHRVEFFFFPFPSSQRNGKMET